MGGGNISLSGSITVGGNGCGGGCNDASMKVQALELSCRQTYSGAVVSSDVPFAITSPNGFTDIPLLEQLSEVEFLYIKFNSAVTLRLYADVAELVGSGGTFPTGFVGGETLIAKVDAFASFTTTFQAGDQSAAQCATRINQAAIGAGYTFLPASVDTSGQLKLSGLTTGAEGTVLVTGGTAQADLGFAADTNDEAHGAGADLVVNGQFMAEFDTQNAPSRIQVKGSPSSVTLVAAGPSATG